MEAIRTLDMIYWISATLFPLTAMLVMSFLSFLAGRLTRKLSDKLSAQAKSATMTMIDMVVANGAAFAEQMSAKHAKRSGEKMAGDSKMELAIACISGEAEKNGLPHMTSEEIQRKVEAYLGLCSLNGNFGELEDDDEANIFDDK